MLTDSITRSAEDEASIASRIVEYSMVKADSEPARKVA